MAASDEGLHEFTKFAGLRNNVDAGNYDAGDLEVAENIDIDDAGEVKLRRGHGEASVVGSSHSIWSDGDVCLAVIDNALTRILPGLTTTVLRAGLVPGRPVSYATDGNRVFYSNGLQNGVVQNGADRSWGLEIPPAPGVTVVPGALPAGRYQFVTTYVRTDGQESGASRAGFVTLTEPGGLQFALDVPVDPDVVEMIVYVTRPDGEELHEIGHFAAGTLSALFVEPSWPGARLETQHLSPPPAGEHVALCNGHMYVAAGRMLYPSEPYNYELFDLRRAVALSGQITMLASMEDGLFVGTPGKTIYLPGGSPEDLEHKVKCEYGVIPGTLSFESADVIGDGSLEGRAAFWASHQGLCAGLNGGRVINLTQDRFAYPAMPTGGGVVRRWRGMKQLLVTMQGAETSANAAA